QGCSLVELFVSDFLRLRERFVKRHRNPRIRFVNLAPDRNRVHDRKDLRLAVGRALDLDVGLEQAPHFVGLRVQCGRHARTFERVDLTRGEQVRERLVRPDVADPDARRQVELELLLAPGFFHATSEIFAAFDGHAVLVLQYAAYPDRRRHLVFDGAHALADQVFWLAYPAAG